MRATVGDKGGPDVAPAWNIERDRLRVGVDLVCVDEVTESLRDFGAKYADRVFTPRENADCKGPSPARDRSLAARFAAKEATLKVLRVSDRVPRWLDIEVVSTPTAPELHLHGLAAELAVEQDLASWGMSLAHEGPMAVAVVLAMSGEVRPPVLTVGPALPKDVVWKTSSVGS